MKLCYKLKMHRGIGGMFAFRTCSNITTVLLLCTEDDNSSYRNVCKMSVVSFALAVIFIRRGLYLKQPKVTETLGITRNQTEV